MNSFATPEQLNRFRLIVAEFGSIDWARNWDWTNDMGHAIVTFDMTGQLLLQPQIEFSCFWNTRWIDVETKPRDHDALDKDGNLLPTGMALKIWGNFLGTRMVKSDSTGKILSYASFDPGSRTLYAYLINKGDSMETITLSIKNHDIKSIRETGEFYGTSPEDIHPVWQAKKIGPGKPISLKGTSITVIKVVI